MCKPTNVEVLPCVVVDAAQHWCNRKRTCCNLFGCDLGNRWMRQVHLGLQLTHRAAGTNYRLTSGTTKPMLTGKS